MQRGPRAHLYMDMPLIDCHIHAGDLRDFHPYVVEWVRSFQGDLSTYDEQERLVVERLEAFLEAEGVDSALVLPEYSPDNVGLVSADQVAALCQASKRLVPMGGINPHLHSDPLAEAIRQRELLGVVGFKLHPVHQGFYPNDESLYPVYAYCEENGLPVMVHTGSSIFRGAKLKYGDPLLMDDVAADFPGLSLILSHAGRGIWYEAASLMARLHRRVYLDISGLPPSRLLDYLPNLEAQAGKVLFGSDWPGAPSIRANAEAVSGLGLSTDALEAILWRNTATLFGLPVGVAP